ncbi:MAG: SLBB domain-containing protein, partial [Proteobacteria bacterium]|nr:SLBB domain-containing protein [Pseudomonadota bacterium]
VGQPGAYPFSGSEMRLLDVISQAGGVTIFAHEDSTKIVRGDPTRPEVISADLKKLVEEGDQTQNVALANGDLVYVPRSSIGDINLFAKRIRPLFELILLPTRIITDIDSAQRILTE